MKFIAIDEDVLQNIQKKLEAIEKASSEKGQDPALTWIDNQEFCQLLKISPRTAQNMRDSGRISFSQPGGSRVYYKLSDVHQMLESHYKPAFK